MKTKLYILLLIIFSFTQVMVSGGLLRAEGETKIKVNSSGAPSEEYLNSAEGYIKKGKASLATDKDINIVKTQKGIVTLADTWSDPTFPGNEDGDGGNMGNIPGPIADATWPIVFSIFILYLIYKGATTSRRRNNF